MPTLQVDSDRLVAYLLNKRETENALLGDLSYWSQRAREYERRLQLAQARARRWKKKTLDARRSQCSKPS